MNATQARDQVRRVGLCGLTMLAVAGTAVLAPAPVEAAQRPVPGASSPMRGWDIVDHVHFRKLQMAENRATPGPDRR